MRRNILKDYIKNLYNHVQDPIFKDSYYLFVTYIIVVGSGFIFWVIGARLYSANDLGLATAIISIIGLISMLSFLGFDIALVKYIPELKEQEELINSCLTVSLVCALVLTLIFLLGINIWSPSLIVLRENTLVMVLFVIITTISPLITLQSFGVFAGLKKGEYSLMQNMVIPLRLLFLVLLIPFGIFGIVFSYGIVFIIAFVVGILLTSKLVSYRFIPTVKKDVIMHIFRFSSGNYIARIFENLPTFILPLMIINMLGADQNAYFFIAWQISMLLLAIPYVIYISLIAENTQSMVELRKNTKKAAILIFVSLSVASIFLLLFGKFILFIFGPEYAANSYDILILFVIGNFIYYINTLYATVNRVLKKTNYVIFIYVTIGLFTLIFTYVLIPLFGLIGVGYAWIIANGLIIMISLPQLKKHYL